MAYRGYDFRRTWQVNLPSSIVYNDQNNNFGAFYQDIHEIAAPAAPAGKQWQFIL